MLCAVRNDDGQVRGLIAAMTTGAPVVTTSSEPTRGNAAQSLYLKALSAPLLRTNLTPGGKLLFAELAKMTSATFDNYPDVTKKEENELAPGDHWVGEYFSTKVCSYSIFSSLTTACCKIGYSHKEVQRQDYSSSNSKVQPPRAQPPTEPVRHPLLPPREPT